MVDEGSDPTPTGSDSFEEMRRCRSRDGATMGSFVDAAKMAVTPRRWTPHRFLSEGVGRRLRQELDVPGRDVVHRADDRDPTAPDEVAEGLALLDELLDDARHVATRHGIDEGFLLEGRELLDGPAFERVGQLLDLLDD